MNYIRRPLAAYQHEAIYRDNESLILTQNMVGVSKLIAVEVSECIIFYGNKGQQLT